MDVLAGIAGIVIFLIAVLAMRLGADPNRDSPLERIDKMRSETKMYQVRREKTR